ncbi:MAG: hypothetical protein J5J00_11555 [Deltaproteobacteria bacterium]|nr:hypothetical protein [Deltaproteobacteria bacterium]
MSLSSVLSAMRQIILDAPALSADQSERLAAFKNLFPELTSEEAEDLSKVPPAKFGIYTTSIFAGERNLLQNNFPMTVALLKEAWKRCFGEELSLFKFAKEMHRVKPWTSTASTLLGRNFVEYLRDYLPQVLQDSPFLAELAELELFIRKVRKQRNGAFEACNGLAPENLAEMTVEMVMELEFIVPKCALFKQLGYDLISIRHEFMKDGSALPDHVPATPTAAAVGRNREGHPRCIALSQEIYSYLSVREKEKQQPIEELAEVYVGSQPPSLSEEELFSGFIAEVVRLAHNGVIALLEKKEVGQPSSHGS